MPLRLSQQLLRRSFTDDLKNTGKSFKNWDSCMNDKACKIIAIVGICLACLVGLWLVGAILTCFRQGVTGIFEFCCWCGRCCGNSSEQARAANNPAMVNAGYQGYAPQPNVVYQPIQYPENAYYANNDNSFYSEGGARTNTATAQSSPRKLAQTTSEVFELEQDFDLENQRRKSMKKNKNKKNKVVYDTDPVDGDFRDSFVNNAAAAGSATHLTTNAPPQYQPATRPYPEDSYFQSVTRNNTQQHHNQGYYY